MSIIFDQYQRYKNAQKIIDSARKEGQIFKILEVGANEHKDLEKFLPNDKITYLDVKLSDEMKKDPAYVLGDATQMEFEDNAYDIVIALDVFEHIFPDRRKAFLDELERVSSIMFVLCAPFDVEEVHETEIRVNKAFRCFAGIDHPWLIEHIENGIPDFKKTISYLKTKEYCIETFSHGNLDQWEKLITLHMFSALDEKLIDFADSIYDYYNSYVFPMDYSEKSYRQFIVGHIATCDYNIEKKELDERVYQKLNELEEQFWKLYNNSKVGIVSNQLNLQPEKEKLEIYFDLGNGFSEEQCLKYYLEENQRVVRKIDCSEFQQMIRIRIDPMEHAGIVRFNDICFIAENDRKISFCEKRCKNLIFKDGENYGFQDDAQIIFNIRDAKEIVLDYEYVNMPVNGVGIFKNFINEKNKLKEKYDIKERENKEVSEKLEHYKEHYFAAINQREDLKKNLENINRAYSDVLNSQCWRMTKPIRVVLGGVENWMRSHRSTYLIGKGIKSICTEGMGATAEKVKKYKQVSVEFGTYKDEVKAAHRSKQTIENVNKNITFSIVVPLYNTQKDFLKEMIQSVINQTYEEWELCMADGSDSEHGYVGRICEKYAASEKRIKYKHLEKNGGISENTNEALKMATGQYIGLFDHDDLLHPSALYEYMKVINERNADFIYCDENKFEEIDDKFFDPNFKPDFDLDYLRANNYICHFSVFSHTLLDQVGKFRKEYDGSQDHDMILRLTEQAKEIVHIPKVLYHWRCSKFSVASNPDVKPYTAESGIKAVNEHLKRCGLNGYAESSSVHPNVYRLHYEIKGKPLISIIIPNKDHVVDLSRCIESILQKSTYLNYEIIIVENNSTERETFEYYDKIQKKDNIQVKIYEVQGEFNYSAINNFGVKYANGEHILLLNNDIEIISDSWLEEMLMFSQREDVGAVGAKLYYPNNTIQHAGVILGIGGVAGHSHKYFDRSAPGYMSRCFIQQDLSAVTAACLMMKKSVFEQVNGLDEENFKVAFNDVDLCMKIRKAGYLIVWTPYAEAYHYESISRGMEDTPEKQIRFKREAEAFMEKWKKELEAGDPYYNPNLTLAKEDFSIKRKD